MLITDSIGEWALMFKFVVNIRNMINRPNVANFVVFKENKACNITTGRVLNMARYPCVVWLYRCYEWFASVGNVLVWIAQVHECVGTLLIKEV